MTIENGCFLEIILLIIKKKQESSRTCCDLKRSYVNEKVPSILYLGKTNCAVTYSLYFKREYYIAIGSIKIMILENIKHQMYLHTCLEEGIYFKKTTW